MARGGKPSSTLSVFSRAARAGSKRRNENKRRKEKKDIEERRMEERMEEREERRKRGKKEGGRAFQHVPRTRTSLKHEAPDIL